MKPLAIERIPNSNVWEPWFGVERLVFTYMEDTAEQRITRSDGSVVEKKTVKVAPYEISVRMDPLGAGNLEDSDLTKFTPRIRRYEPVGDTPEGKVIVTGSRRIEPQRDGSLVETADYDDYVPPPPKSPLQQLRDKTRLTDEELKQALAELGFAASK